MECIQHLLTFAAISARDDDADTADDDDDDGADNGGAGASPAGLVSHPSSPAGPHSRRRPWSIRCRLLPSHPARRNSGAEKVENVTTSLRELTPAASGSDISDVQYNPDSTCLWFQG